MASLNDGALVISAPVDMTVAWMGIAWERNMLIMRNSFVHVSHVLFHRCNRLISISAMAQMIRRSTCCSDMAAGMVGGRCTLFFFFVEVFT